MAPDETGYPLSFAQEQLWVVDQLRAGDSGEYLMHEALRLRGDLDRAALNAALTEIAARHEILRTRYGTVDGAGSQIIDPPGPVTPAEADLTAIPAAERADRLREVAAAHRAAPLDLRVQPPWRWTLVRLDAREWVLLATVHHIAFDGRSWSLLAAELDALYAAFAAGQPAPLEPLALQYADFAQWERDRRQAAPEAEARGRDYWRQRLAGLEPLDLPTDHPRPARWQAGGAGHSFTVPAPLAARLAEAARARGATPFMLHLALLQLLLARHSGQRDVAVGVSVSRREAAELDPLIGMFLGTVVMRTDLSGDPGFGALLGRVRDTVLDAQAHADVPFERVVADLAPERDLSRNPVFQVGYALHGAEEQPFRLTGMEVTREEVPVTGSAFDLSLHLTERPDGSLAGLLVYPTALFDAARTERMAGHLLTLMRSVAQAPDAPLSGLEHLTDAERDGLTRWHRSAPAPTGRSLPELFLDRARATPGAVAVISGEEQTTYAELADRVGRLAGHLRALGVTRHTPVAVAAGRGTGLVTAVLAVLAAGGAYVPLAPEYPADRLAYQAADAGTAVLVTERALAERLPAHPVTVLLDDPLPPPATAPLPAVDGQDPAYIMYTSGSTGRPKGVVVPHAAIRNRVLWSVDRYGLGPGDRLLQKTTIGFDAAVWEFLSPLVAGATVVAAPPEAHRDTAVMAAALAEHRITVLQLVPSVLRLLLEEPALDACTTLRLVCSAGEPLPADLCATLHARTGAEVWNTYGPTECAIDSTAWRWDGGTEGIVPIGRPLTGAAAYVVDRDDRLVPVGVTGELCVGGVGLAHGYLGRAALTAERFGPDPYATEPGARWYRTGDLVRRRADGVLEFVGRADDQVKLRGVRIEPAEVEAVLAAHPAVAAAAVAVRTSPAGDAELVAWTVAAGAPAAPEELRAHLAARLPEAMVPSLLVGLDALPVTPSGKVDRRALPDPHAAPATAAETGAEPRTAAERAVAALMADVLGVPRVGADDDFFDLGGHSLVAIRLMLRLRRELGVKLTVGELFAARTVAALAARVEELMPAEDTTDAEASLTAGEQPVRPVPRDGDLPLSYGQQRMWFLDQLDPGSDEYLVPVGLRLRGPLQVEAFRQALDATVARHEVLRTRYVAVGGTPRQRIDPPGPVPFRLADVSGQPRPEEAARRLLEQEAARPFVLADAWPLRVTLVRTAREEHLALVTLHHIAFDAWSMGIWLRDLDRAYRALSAGRPAPLEQQAVRYADFAAWQRETGEAGRTAAQLDHWRRRLEGMSPAELPADRPRPAVRDARGATVRTEVPPEVARALAELARERGVTSFTLLLAAFQAVLGRWTGSTDLAVGTPVAGRTRPETEDLVGFFTNTLVLRGDLSGDPAFTTHLDRVHATVTEAFAHQDVPFEHLVDVVRPDRDLSRNPLFQVMFELDHADGALDRLGEVAVAPYEAAPDVAKFDLTVAVSRDGDDRLACVFEYATALFDRTTIERLAGHYLTLLAGVAAAPGTRLGDLPLLTAAERHDLLTAGADPDGGRLPALDPAAEHDLCVPQLVERRARRTPDAVAVVAGATRLTYRELNERANRLAHHLRDLGVGPETVVASCLERSPEAVTALLAVLKAGGVYVPLDPQHPAERLEFMLGDAGADLVLTTAVFAALIGGGRRTVLVDTPVDTPAHDPEPLAGPGHLAYVIYTSGSTGRPKGVMIEHRSYAHHCKVIADAYGIAPGERVALISALTFDVAMDQIAATLVAGATVVVGDPVFWTPAELPARLAEHGVTVVEITPAYYREMLESPALPALTSLKLMNVGSDVVTADDAARWYATGLPARFLCNYGPTEATVTCLLHPVDRAGGSGPGAEALPIGKPVAGTRAYVLDDELRPVPAGVPGELCLGGTRLARGYLGRPGLTADRFVPDPLGDGPGARLYRTGDLVRRRLDGTIEFLGRIDRQVKVRGLRIELGEIEAALLRHPAVREAVVTAPTTAPGERQLVGYVVQAAGAVLPTVPDLRAHLRDRLPEYMIPVRWAFLDALPMTGSGKVDRAALPDPAPAAAVVAEGAHVAPRDATEELLAQLWCEVLGVERVGVTDDFFTLGGHSLLATRVLAGIRSAFAVDLPLRRLFEATTVAALAEAVTQAVEEDIAAMTDEEVAHLLAATPENAGVGAAQDAEG